MSRRPENVQADALSFVDTRRIQGSAAPVSVGSWRLGRYQAHSHSAGRNGQKKGSGSRYRCPGSAVELCTPAALGGRDACRTSSRGPSINAPNAIHPTQKELCLARRRRDAEMRAGGKGRTGEGENGHQATMGFSTILHYALRLSVSARVDPGSCSTADGMAPNSPMVKPCSSPFLCGRIPSCVVREVRQDVGRLLLRRDHVTIRT